MLTFIDYEPFEKKRCKCKVCHRPMDNCKRRIKTSQGKTIEQHRCICGIRWDVNLSDIDDQGEYFMEPTAQRPF